MNKHLYLLRSLLLLVVAGGCLPATAQSNLVWSEEFESGTLNQAHWTIAEGHGNDNSGWGNNELQNYTPENISFNEGCLVITARKVGEGTAMGDYTSARISTKFKKEFLYGRIEARMKLPLGTGVWPAFWMLGANGRWPDYGEIDIMEYVGYEPGIIHSALHTRSSHGGTVNKGQVAIEGREDEFHVYGICWNKEQIAFYIDNPESPFYTYKPEKKTLATWPFDKPCYLLLNLAVGGIWGGKNGVDNSIFPVQYCIDWVRAYTE